MTAVEVAVEGTDMLGECPLWDEQAGELYWVDILAPALYRWRPGGERRVWTLPQPVGSFAFRRGGGVLLALQSGIFTFDLDRAVLTPIVEPIGEPRTNRFNDGRCDRRGRFWVGTMSDVSRDPLGSLYVLSPDGDLRRLFNEIVIPNSIAWSPDDRTMYFADTPRKTIWSFDFDADAGTIANRRVFADLNNQPGRPDGSAMDAEGCLWNCEYAGGRVVRYTPDGRIDRVIEVPADNPTCCAFGGPNLDTLYITSARQRLTPEQLERQPLAGSVFAAHVGVRGLPEARFEG
jgi:sugar lactone lactonase YvrE